MSQWRNPPPVVILSGDHDYLRQREVREAVNVADRCGRSVEYLKGTDRGEISRLLSSTGMFFEEEVLVVVDDPENIDADLVIKHHESGDNDTVLVLHQKGAIKAKTNLAKVVKALPDRFVAKFEKPKPWEAAEHAANYCSNEARKLGIRLDVPLAMAIVQHAGSDLGVLSFEARKLAFLLGSTGEKEVKGSHVKKTIASFSELGPKPVVEALEKRDLAATSNALINMRRTHAGNVGGATLLACAWIGRSATTWLQVSALLQEGYKLGEISSRTGLHEFVLRKTHLPVSRRWGKGRLTSLVKSIAKVERAVRSGHVSPWIELECALFRSLEGGLAG
jgi:DNA polymerase III delta subunit